MIENDLDKILNYMKRYVENVYEHDSEIMLNWKDIKLVLEEIERLKERLEDLNTINEEHQILNGMIRKELQQKENIIKEAIEYIHWRLDDGQDMHITQMRELFEILDKGKE